MDSALALGYTGAWRDPVCDGLPLGNGYRTYLPDLMRFNAPDALSPFGEGGINPYVYCSGDPINFADPSGQFQLSWQGGLGIFAALLGIGLAIFTEGSSLAIVGAVLGGASAVTGVAADNTEGTAHDVLMGLSMATGLVGGVADVADLGTSAFRALAAAGSDIGRSARAATAVSEARAGSWVSHSGVIERDAEMLVGGGNLSRGARYEPPADGQGPSGRSVGSASHVSRDMNESVYFAYEQDSNLFHRVKDVKPEHVEFVKSILKDHAEQMDALGEGEWGKQEFVKGAMAIKKNYKGVMAHSGVSKKTRERMVKSMDKYAHYKFREKFGDWLLNDNMRQTGLG